jgi:superfamily I DNA and/or RNA helicase
LKFFDKIDYISVGIITPYASQEGYLNTMIKKKICFTVDSFQGSEKDVIFYSAVRCNSNKNIGFVINKQRFNVSITRAKRLLIVIGNSKTLSSSEMWDEYIRWIKDNGFYHKVN